MLDEKYMAVIAHELKNPISVISSQIQMLEESCKDTEYGNKDKNFELLKRNIQRINYIINQSMNMAILEKGSPELFVKDIHVSELVEDLRTSCEIFAKQSNIKLNFNYDEEFLFRADFVKLSQSLVNIILNAIKFSYKNGEVDILFKQEPGIVKIEVKDKGIGIRPEEHHTIFFPFFKKNNAKQNKKGLGLGLFIAKKMVELHKGRIDVYSELGYGATFVVIIPDNL